MEQSIIKLKGKTQHGHDLIRDYGEEWALLHQASQSTNLNGKPGRLVKSNIKDYYMWIEDYPLDFEILDND